MLGQVDLVVRKKIKIKNPIDAKENLVLHIVKVQPLSKRKLNCSHFLSQTKSASNLKNSQKKKK